MAVVTSSRSSGHTNVAARLAGLVVIAAIVLGLLVALALWWLGLVVAVVTAAAGWAFVNARVRRAEDLVLARVGGAKPLGDHTPAELRVTNLVEGLAPNAGVPRPRCLVVEDPALNALAIGRDARTGCLVLTRGLVDAVPRLELEAVIAHALVRLRDGRTAAPTLLLATRAPRWLGGAVVDDQAQTDLAAVQLTRYPPGLAAVLARIAAAGPAVPAGAAPELAPCWMAPPGSDVAARIATLGEL